ncbi:serine/threonine-protein phosphatase 2A activator-like [Watersipora subatra]|uniref:serine/threonine-protein phosphatase 2A activator-like n=1 Tax=Watersipora subatra TaxID=2589382 RepID=UPI00355B4021
MMDISQHKFSSPVKLLSQANMMPQWIASHAYADLTGFISAMNDAVKDKKLSEKYPISAAIEKLSNVLSTLSKWIDDIPPIDQPQRFGNKAFKQFYDKLVAESSTLLEEMLDERFHSSVCEIKVYLNEAFGNSTRIDYGTGHEFAFIAFLCCLYKLEILLEPDSVATVFNIFNQYIGVCRKLQTTYNMEPAGSHGVWSLDDFHFLPFIWGSSQLNGQSRISPAKAVQEDYYLSFYKDYMYLAAVKHICSVKTGPFPEHSNQLWNISGVPLWSKVNSGLIKMYKAEVLAKYPVIQHFLFGSLLTLDPFKN